MSPPYCGSDAAYYNFTAGAEKNWNYEKPSFVYYEQDFWGIMSLPSGSYEFSVATPATQPNGTYTVLFFNGEDRIAYQTVTASVTYMH